MTNHHNRFWIYGFHAVEAALENDDRPCFHLKTTKNPETYKSYREGNPKLVIDQVDHKQLSSLLGEDAVHQGIALQIGDLPDLGAEDLIDIAQENSANLIVALDQITDPHNVGAILRSAAAFGAIGLLVPKDHSVNLKSPVLFKAASGACEHVPMIEITNLVRTLETFQKEGFWSVGLAEQGEKTLDQTDLKGNMIIVMGAEGDGLRRLTRDSCDFLARLSTVPEFPTLNVSNAAALAFYEFHRQNTAPAKK